ncbi:hypothetical protein GCM10010123_24590 [Pilimelia anulata]|uniref:Uncharacterized protein n=1 Tax=Pilimelia anulata TaxID=53371 RepID=A0A8J3BAS8_9ACTN|nr:transcriptional regulator [Pilimelia anulata]GGJ93819.1 hypothetical protein GCM10010123_24590 [Pilimelia anulata]
MALIGGHRFKIAFGEMFPNGCVLVPDSIAEAMDFDEKSGRRTPAKDKVTGQRVYQCRVMDMDEQLAGRSRELTVKVLGDHQPAPPVGPFQPVEFSGLMVTAYVGQNGRLAYSLRATGMFAPKSQAESRGEVKAAAGAKVGA